MPREHPVEGVAVGEAVTVVVPDAGPVEELEEVEFELAGDAKLDWHSINWLLQCCTDKDPPTPPPTTAAIVTIPSAISSQTVETGRPQIRRCVFAFRFSPESLCVDSR
jgi:hypothetical protein